MAALVQSRILVQDLKFSYRKETASLPVFDGLSFEVKRGETLSVLGPSGCGKSTLLKLILGQLLPDVGRTGIESEGKAVALEKVSYIPQFPILLPWRTALQNATLNIELRGKLTEPSRRRVADDFMLFGLETSEDRFPDELSGGMAQRVSLIRALSTSPSVILADEPFSALDYLARIDLNRKFKQRADIHGTTTLFVTHNVEEAVYLSERVLVLPKKVGQLPVMVSLPRTIKENDPVEFRQSHEFLDNVALVWQALQMGEFS